MKSVNDKLREAASEGDEAGLKALLLRPKCDPMVKNTVGVTALMYAASNGHASCVELLIPLSDGLAKDDDGATALMHAAACGAKSCVQLLLPASAALAKDDDGRTASDYARRNGNASLCALIDAYALAMKEAVALSASTGLLGISKSTPLRV